MAETTDSGGLQHFGDNFIPVILVDDVIHTEDNPDCGDPECLCQPGAIAESTVLSTVEGSK